MRRERERQKRSSEERDVVAKTFLLIERDMRCRDTNRGSERGITPDQIRGREWETRLRGNRWKKGGKSESSVRRGLFSECDSCGASLPLAPLFSLSLLLSSLLTHPPTRFHHNHPKGESAPSLSWRKVHRPQLAQHFVPHILTSPFSCSRTLSLSLLPLLPSSSLHHHSKNKMTILDKAKNFAQEKLHKDKKCVLSLLTFRATLPSADTAPLRPRAATTTRTNTIATITTTLPLLVTGTQQHFFPVRPLPPRE